MLKEQVLYIFKASEDVKALETIPVLGYVVETFKEVSYISFIFKIFFPVSNKVKWANYEIILLSHFISASDF